MSKKYKFIAALYSITIFVGMYAIFIQNEILLTATLCFTILGLVFAPKDDKKEDSATTEKGVRIKDEPTRQFYSIRKNFDGTYTANIVFWRNKEFCSIYELITGTREECETKIKEHAYKPEVEKVTVVDGEIVPYEEPVDTTA